VFFHFFYPCGLIFSVLVGLIKIIGGNSSGVIIIINICDKKKYEKAGTLFCKV
jgi:hypothetical protein